MAYYKCGKIFATQNSNTSIETASGAIANFNTSLAMPVLDCIAEFSATQDLHGQSAPYPAGGGKNKANFVNGYGISISGEVEANLARFATVEAIPIKSGETYYVKKMQSGACSFIVAVYNGSTLVSRVSGLNSGDTIDTTGGDSFRVAGYASGSSVTFEAVEAMVVTDNTVTAYAPYSNICPIVGVDKVAIYSGGKNLIDLSSLIEGYVASNGTFVTTHTNGEMRSGFIPVRPNTNYFFSIVETTGTASAWVGIGLYKDNDVSSFIERKSYWSFTTSADTRFIVVSARNLETATKIQLEEGSTATDYEPYNGTTALINLGGTYYGGSVDAVTGKITLDHKKFTFDGSENWSVTDTHIFRLVTTLNNWLPVNAENWQKVFYSNILRTDVRATGASLAKLPDHCFYITTQYLYVRLDEYELADFKTALGSTNLQIVAPVSTPEIVYASNTAELLTKAGLNNIFCDTGDIEVKYRKLHSDN